MTGSCTDVQGDRSNWYWIVENWALRKDGEGQPLESRFQNQHQLLIGLCMHFPAQGAQNSCHHFLCICLHIRSSHGSVALHFFQCTGICFQQRLATAASGIPCEQKSWVWAMPCESWKGGSLSALPNCPSHDPTHPLDSIFSKPFPINIWTKATVQLQSTSIHPGAGAAFFSTHLNSWSKDHFLAIFSADRVMGIRLPSKIHNAKQILKLQSLLSRNQSSVPKGHCAVYVGEIQKKRFVVPISYLNHPAFQDLLHLAEEEFGFDHPMGGLTIPCEEDAFIDLTSRLNAMSVM